MKTSITFEIDTDSLSGYTDQHLADLWHITQANPAPFGDLAACRAAEYVGREIIRRFLGNTAPNLWSHQGEHINAAGSAATAAPAATDHLIEKINAWAETNNGPVTMADVCKDVLGMATVEMNSSTFTRVGCALNALGFNRVEKRIPYQGLVERYFVRGKNGNAFF